ncbi:hypothetical protein PM082_003343 [Marasmius tenuissimus]|nr:hypothetical protein PM082_003343 [Marasmius tenuissimus]
MSFSLSFWNTLIVFLAFLALLCTKIFPNSQLLDSELQDVLPVSHLARLANQPLERLSLQHIPTPDPGTADVTAVILNWSRLPNVIHIVSVLCSPALDGVLETIFIWNNNPSVVLTEDLLGCQRKIRIENSPHNAYFAARFNACALASTPYCFIQDDDYLVLPEIVYALRARIAKTSPSGIFLQPPDEMLASTLSRITVDHRVHTSFNWLGYGSIIPRSEARGFLEATRALNLTEEEVKMADNYFSVLRNTFPENWFDQNTPLGGGQAFTVGQEGTERNNHHIRRAGELLDSVVLCEGESCTFPNNVEDPFARSESPAETLTSVTPCVGAACVLTTSVQLLNSTPDMRVQSARSMLDNQARNIESLAQEERDFYLKHPPSQAVDGKLETGFCRNGAKKGESLALEVLHGAPLHWKHLEIAMLVDQGAQAMIRKGSFHLLAGAKSFVLRGGTPVCDPVEGSTLMTCHIGTISPQSRVSFSFHFMLGNDTMKSWCIYEMWIRGTG